MYRNYLKIAWRNLLRQKTFSAIKIGGFALSIATCLLIALFIRNELSYDKSYPDTARLFRVTGEYNDNGNIETGADWPAPMAAALEQNFPEIQETGRLMPHDLFYGAGSNEIRRTDHLENTFEQGFTYADQGILDILEIPMIYGRRETALAEPNTMVVTKKISDKFFPGENPLGKVMILNNDIHKTYRITGVIPDFPPTSHIRYDFFLTLSGFQLWPGEREAWGNYNYYTYVLLKPGASAARLQSKLGLIETKYFIPEARRDGVPDPDEIARKAHILLQPISSVHLEAIDDELPHGDPRFIWLFGAIACFILIIASINFVNLATARSANRAKEVGLRKVVGCLKSDLIHQFLAESLVISFLSFILGILLAWILTPYFNLLTAKSLVFPWREWWLLPVTFGAALVTGVLAGLYPAFYLSAFKPIRVLKGNLSRGSKNSLLRNGLVVFQFTTSIALIIGTLVIENQMQFILHRKIGFNKDQVVLLEGMNTMNARQVTIFKNELLRIPHVVKASASDFLPVSGTPRNQNPFFKAGAGSETNEVDGQGWLVDADYIPTLGMKMVEGRNFSPDIPSDSQAVIINQSMAAKLHLQNPVGARITNDPHDPKGPIYHVIGVVQDFNFESMRDQIGALCLHLGQGSSTISVRIGSKDMGAALGSISTIWKQFNPNQPIRYTFLDKRFAEMYDDVTRTGRIFTSFAVLAIIVACLGLFALSAFMAEQRLREIGIRKVLGATAVGITSMLSGGFLKLVLVSIVLASPLAWIFMNRWLRDFAYSIHISWWMFALSGLIALFIALGTISFQSIRAALVNPAGLLRSE